MNYFKQLGDLDTKIDNEKDNDLRFRLTLARNIIFNEVVKLEKALNKIHIS
jgi:hypothetical protein